MTAHSPKHVFSVVCNLNPCDIPIRGLARGLEESGRDRAIAVQPQGDRSKSSDFGGHAPSRLEHRFQRTRVNGSVFPGEVKPTFGLKE
jgi:hypothetical protein